MPTRAVARAYASHACPEPLPTAHSPQDSESGHMQAQAGRSAGRRPFTVSDTSILCFQHFTFSFCSFSSMLSFSLFPSSWLLKFSSLPSCLEPRNLACYHHLVDLEETLPFWDFLPPAPSSVLNSGLGKRHGSWFYWNDAWGPQAFSRLPSQPSQGPFGELLGTAGSKSPNSLTTEVNSNHTFLFLSYHISLPRNWRKALASPMPSCSGRVSSGLSQGMCLPPRGTSLSRQDAGLGPAMPMPQTGAMKGLQEPMKLCLETFVRSLGFQSSFLSNSRMGLSLVYCIIKYIMHSNFMSHCGWIHNPGQDQNITIPIIHQNTVSSHPYMDVEMVL